MSTSTATLPQAAHFLTVCSQKGLSVGGGDRLNKTGLLADLVEAADHGDLKAVDRNAFRVMLGLPPIPADPVLKLIGTVTIPAIGRFCAQTDLNRQKFNLAKRARVLFGDKVENQIPSTTLYCHMLVKKSRDRNIRSEIGEKRSLITLGQFASFLEIHGNSLEMYIAYIVDQNGEVWPMRAIQHSNHWNLGIHTYDDHRGWDGSFIISC